MIAVLVGAAAWGRWVVPPQALALLVGIGIPLLTGVLTKLQATSALKATVAAVLAALLGYLTQEVTAFGVVEFWPVLQAILTAGVAAWASYHGLWKPTQIAPKVQTATAGFGLGSGNPPQHSV